jgi:hypothetical protein
MADVDPANIPLPADEPQQPLQRDIKLPPFWTSRPRAWFTYVESTFRLRRITDDQQMFDHVLSALPTEMVSQVIDVVDALPAAGQYEFFKNELLNIDQLSDYEKFDALVKMEPMGGRKPSQLLHAMLEFCPLGMEQHLSFHYFFMQRLPQALRTQLGEVQPGDPRALAVRADRLWSVHTTNAVGTVAVANGQEDPPAASIAAVRGAGGRGRDGRSRGRGAARGAAKAPAAPAAPTGVPAAEPTPSDLARVGSGLCFFHWTFADKAAKCVAPCTWGN